MQMVLSYPVGVRLCFLLMLCLTYSCFSLWIIVDAKCIHDSQLETTFEAKQERPGNEDNADMRGVDNCKLYMSEIIEK